MIKRKTKRKRWDEGHEGWDDDATSVRSNRRPLRSGLLPPNTKRTKAEDDLERIFNNQTNLMILKIFLQDVWTRLRGVSNGIRDLAGILRLPRVTTDVLPAIQTQNTKNDPKKSSSIYVGPIFSSSTPLESTGKHWSFIIAFSDDATRLESARSPTPPSFRQTKELFCI